jgi:hypothetical protein
MSCQNPVFFLNLLSVKCFGCIKQVCLHLKCTAPAPYISNLFPYISNLVPYIKNLSAKQAGAASYIINLSADIYNVTPYIYNVTPYIYNVRVQPASLTGL